jgi:hypothetical protein
VPIQPSYSLLYTVTGIYIYNRDAHFGIDATTWVFLPTQFHTTSSSSAGTTQSPGRIQCAIFFNSAVSRWHCGRCNGRSSQVVKVIYSYAVLHRSLVLRRIVFCIHQYEARKWHLAKLPKISFTSWMHISWHNPGQSNAFFIVICFTDDLHIESKVCHQ